MSRREPKGDEVVETEADGSGGGGIAGAILAPLIGAPRNINGALEDLRSIAEGMRVLPALLVSLERIETRVESLDEEVVAMRRAVESMGGGVEALADHLGEVSGGVGRLEPHLVEMRHSLRPLKRAMGRLNRPGRVPPGDDLAP